VRSDVANKVGWAHAARIAAAMDFPRAVWVFLRVMWCMNVFYSNMKFDFYLKTKILRGNNRLHTKEVSIMSTAISLPTPSTASQNLFERASQFVARLFSAGTADAGDLWKLYRAAGSGDSVNPRALKALLAATRAE
jgi:hypothetical protein